MHVAHVTLVILIALAIAVAGVLTVLDEVLSDTPHSGPQPADPVSYREPRSENTERRSRGECRT
jgi:hypothetical protein